MQRVSLRRIITAAKPRVRVCVGAPVAAVGWQPRRWNSDGGHPDFNPVIKAAAEESVKDRIKKDLTAHKVVLYMKGNPWAPQCGFSNRVIQILNHYQVDYAAYNVLEDMDLRQGIKEYSEWPTIPQLYVDGEFVGGCDIISGMHESGNFTEEMKDLGATFKPNM